MITTPLHVQLTPAHCIVSQKLGADSVDFLAKDGTYWINVMPGLYSLPFLQQHVSVRALSHHAQRGLHPICVALLARPCRRTRPASILAS